MQNLNRIYFYSFVTGWAEGLFFIFAPFVLALWGYNAQALVTGIWRILAFSPNSIWNIIVPLLIITLPLFFIFLYFAFKNTSEENFYSVFFSFIFFSCGVTISYAFWFYLALGGYFTSFPVWA